MSIKPATCLISIFHDFLKHLPHLKHVMFDYSPKLTLVWCNSVRLACDISIHIHSCHQAQVSNSLSRLLEEVSHRVLCENMADKQHALVNSYYLFLSMQIEQGNMRLVKSGGCRNGFTKSRKCYSSTILQQESIVLKQ